MHALRSRATALAATCDPTDGGRRRAWPAGAPGGLVVAASLGLVGCGADEATASGGPAPPSGLFAQGCPEPARALARVLQGPDERAPGPHALAAPGDVLLASERAAFVVAHTGEARTYYYYGGILVDAVAVEGCAPAAPERFGELAPLAGHLNLGDFTASELRGFHGTSLEILSDGSDGGAAVVRAHGVDDRFWLVEMELQRRSWDAGTAKPTSAPFGVEFDVDYILDPGSAVLRVEPRLTNLADQPQRFLVGAALFTGDTTPTASPPHFEEPISVGGVNVGVGAPWLAMGAEAGSYAATFDAPLFGSTNISGVNALLDVGQVAAPVVVQAAGEEGETASVRLLVAVGATDRNSATRELHALAPGGRSSTPVPVAGRVTEADGSPVPGAVIDVQRADDAGAFATLDELRAGADGAFAGVLPDYGDQRAWRLVARDPGRSASAPLEVTLPAALDALSFTLEPPGALGYVVRDEAGAPLPAKLTLTQPDDTGAEREVRRLFTVDGVGEARVEPGRYRVHVTRGYEYEIAVAEVDVAATVTSPLEVTLRRVVDTTGFLSVDGHVHQAPSDDSTVTVAHRMDTVAAEGLEVMVATDHEIIEDLAASADARRLSAFLSVVNGQEVTAASPEHTNVWGIAPDPTHPRGGPVRWHGLGLGEIYAAERARGARLVVLNHPREHGGCSWLCAIDWDRLTGEPRVTDPTIFGMDPGVSMWSWDFDAVELLNGTKDIFLREDPRRSGKFDDWMAFFNLGHRITGVATSDSHDEHDLGAPRTYFAAPTDDPAAFRLEMLEAAIHEGRAVMSAGAFARVSVDGAGPGETASVPGGNATLTVTVSSLPEIDVSEVKVFVNCDEVATLTPSARTEVVKLDTTVPLSLARDAHVVVVGWGATPMPIGFLGVPRPAPRVVTNPVFVDVDGGGYTPPGGKACAYTAPR